MDEIKSDEIKASLPLINDPWRWPWNRASI